MEDSLVTKWGIPLSHLDYSFIEKCQDARYLEKLCMVLRSGQEGLFPDLTAFCEERLLTMNPASKLLKSDVAPLSSNDAGNEIYEEMNQWLNDIKNIDAGQESGAVEDLPPIRKPQYIHSSGSSVSAPAKPKNPVPKSYEEWDSINKGIDENDENSEQMVAGPGGDNLKGLSLQPDATGLTDEEKEAWAGREKEKGNEAFRAGDFKEAALYYSRSLSLQNNVATYNNRALAHIRLKRWDKAILDCNRVLAAESCNVKGLMRRATAYKEKRLFEKAKVDLDKVMNIEPQNKRAEQLLKDVRNEIIRNEKRKGGEGRRVIIEEVDSSSESEAEAEEVKYRNGDSEKTDKTPSAEEETVALEEQPVEPISRSEIRVPELPSDVHLLKVKADGLFRTGQYTDSLDSYAKAVDALLAKADKNFDPHLSIIYSNRAGCYFKIGDCRSCIDDCEASLQLCPFSVKPLLRRAAAYETLEKFKEAYVDYKHVQSIDTSIEIAFQGASRCMQALQQAYGSAWRQKVQELPRVNSSEIPLYQFPEKEKQVSKPEDLLTEFDSLKSQGNDFVRKRDYKQAALSYEKCIKLCPDNTVSYTNRALCNLKLGCYAQVVSDCDCALSLDSKNVKALFRRAQALDKLGEYDRSRQDLTTLLDIEPDNNAAKKELNVVQSHALVAKRQADNEMKTQSPTPAQKVPKPQQSMPKPPKVDEKVVPKLAKCSSYEFMHAWSNLERCGSPEKIAELVKQVPPSSLHEILGSKLDAAMLSQLLAAFAVMDDISVIYDYLLHLSRADRFDIATMFLTDDDKATLNKMIDLMVDRYGHSELEVLKFDYGLLK